jgi:ubiquitin-conjugating enzyme E2 W
MASISARRLGKELRDLQTNGCPVGIELIAADNWESWVMGIEVLGDNIYAVSIIPPRYYVHPHGHRFISHWNHAGGAYRTTLFLI